MLDQALSHMKKFEIINVNIAAFRLHLTKSYSII
jgi:hypothetical protein